MKKVIVCILFTYLLLNSLTVKAWDANGHRIVAEIAGNYLDPGVRDSVQKYLGSTTFAEAAVWMDEVRKDHFYDYMKSWHYVNVEKDKTYVATSEDNIINALQNTIRELGNRSKLSKKEIKADLKILFHLTGDLHQPLHVGYGDDKGGNSLQVTVLGRSTNLHHVWDTDLIEAKQITADDCLKLASALTVEQRNEIEKVDVIQWMNESRSLLPAIYDFRDRQISKDYINKNAPLVVMQLVKGGLRLASVLNGCFAKKQP
jgi:hypothetical protein